MYSSQLFGGDLPYLSNCWYVPSLVLNRFYKLISVSWRAAYADNGDVIYDGSVMIIADAEWIVGLTTVYFIKKATMRI